MRCKTRCGFEIRTGMNGKLLLSSRTLYRVRRHVVQTTPCSSPSSNRIPEENALMRDIGRSVVAEGVGTALLLAAVVGSGIMGERLANGNAAIALLAN